jgi:hypothetical protein
MVDRTARFAAARLVHNFSAGAITNRDFEAEYPGSSRDPAIAAIYEQVFLYYDDYREHRLADGDVPPTEVSDLLKRCEQFLMSDLEYEWPPKIRIAGLRLWLTRLLGLSRRAKDLERREIEQRRLLGDWDLWPFFRSADYESAVSLDRGRGDSTPDFGPSRADSRGEL